MRRIHPTSVRESNPGHQPCRPIEDRRDKHLPRWLRSWVLVNSALAGMLALLWVLLRSGAKPSRLAYPCQQAALGTATAALGVPVVATAVTLRHRLVGLVATRTGKLALALALATGLGMLTYAAVDGPAATPLLETPERYAPDIFVVENARGIIDGERYGGVDDLFTLMGLHGVKIFKSNTVSRYSGPDGIIAPEDVVLIKINEQWSQRGGTNTDVLRGLIRRLVEHPDGWPVEIVVVENGQGGGNFYRTQNNAENHAQNPAMVVADFVAEGYPVSAWLWDGIRYSSVQEYSDGNMSNGYVVNPVVDPESNVRVSYPKFQTAGGHYVSMKYGIWDPNTQTYDNEHLKFINVPVFKCHFIYGITACVKHHMGVVTRELSTNSHFAIATGGLGSYMAEVRVPDLNILDCIWILARPGYGPDCSYAEATRVDKLVAGFDTVAIDMWAAKYIMIPTIIDNGYGSYPQQDPDNRLGDFRYYIDRTLNELVLAGIPGTIDYTKVALHVWSGPLDGDFDADGDVDLDDFSSFSACFNGANNPPAPTCPGGVDADLDGDGDVDLDDFSSFAANFTGTL